MRAPLRFAAPLVALALFLAACADDAPPPAETPPLTPLAAEPPEADPIDEGALLGGWACEEGIDPEIAFRMEDGERLFASFLHGRPSYRGTWEIREGTLTVQTDGGLTYLFPFVSVEEGRLVLEGPAVRWACTRIEG